MRRLGGALEALLLLAAEPMSVTDLARRSACRRARWPRRLAELAAFYDETGRGFELRELGGGWRYYTREEHADLVAAYVLEGQQAKLSAGRAGDPGGGRLPAADLPGPGVGRSAGSTSTA